MIDASKPDFSFLIGMTESEAFEIIQDHGFVPQVVSRDDIPYRMTMEVQKNRIRFYVIKNKVTGWNNG